MRELFSAFGKMRNTKKPTMLTPSQMAGDDLLAGAHEADAMMGAEAAGTADLASGGGDPMAALANSDFAQKILPSVSSGFQNSIKKAEDDLRAMPFAEAIPQGYDVREQTLARVMPQFARGGFLRSGMGLVGEDGPEIIEAQPDGGVKVIPIETLGGTEQVPATQPMYGLPNTYEAVSGNDRMATPEMRGAVERSTTEPGTITASGEPVIENEPMPARKSAMDVKRWLQSDPYGSGSDAVWGAREDVAEEDYYKAMATPAKKSKWKDLGMQLLISANNAFNNKQDPVRGWSDIKKEEQMAKVAPQLQYLRDRKDRTAKQRRAKLDEDNIVADNKYQQDRITEMAADRQRKENDTIARERTARMRTVAGMLKDLPEFIPGDPKFTEIEQALGDVNLPITQKDAKKKVDLKQDQRTGEWTAILTNPATGQQEVRPVTTKDGKVLATTPTVVMQGEYGMLKQNDQQQYQATENDKTRAQQRDQFLMNFRAKIDQERRQNVLNKAKYLQDLNNDLANGVIDANTYREMAAIVNQ